MSSEAFLLGLFGKTYDKKHILRLRSSTPGRINPWAGLIRTCDRELHASGSAEQKALARSCFTLTTKEITPCKEIKFSHKKTGHFSELYFSFWHEQVDKVSLVSILEIRSLTNWFSCGEWRRSWAVLAVSAGSIYPRSPPATTPTALVEKLKSYNRLNLFDEFPSRYAWACKTPASVRLQGNVPFREDWTKSPR